MHITYIRHTVHAIQSCRYTIMIVHVYLNRLTSVYQWATTKQGPYVLVNDNEQFNSTKHLQLLF